MSELTKIVKLVVCRNNDASPSWRRELAITGHDRATGIGRACSSGSQQRWDDGDDGDDGEMCWTGDRSASREEVQNETTSSSSRGSKIAGVGCERSKAKGKGTERNERSRRKPRARAKRKKEQGLEEGGERTGWKDLRGGALQGCETTTVRCKVSNGG
ncbi:uncharacterized protein THITE_2115858 [Thermothielavioides terrestris NRRL 8126]|uniref:Uncharacterized protein n=1 Tax=Thermothielavioides terrestris (strain ATCC 38088 / NRRL 8126) TaxID=578455 RepID=G2QYI5_THETT|nr:uncharacterized protein THITE_2115858 [Thermothielavioides terrestris NRRL 8126]AEO67080.1 hypothetical protein THITE_2115858 [Thermothielavioides terrestris NRRL 8126]